jgi:predicted RNA-binding Zn-ribbon protein involved in translation (DUF1610 family)
MVWIAAILERIRTMECPACGETSVAIVDREDERETA